MKDGNELSIDLLRNLCIEKIIKQYPDDQPTPNNYN